MGVLQEKPTIKYPKSVAFIISNEFCERFCYYGLRTILVLYLTRNLNYSDDTATQMYHAFASLAYLFPIFGALIADSWLGRFKTILYLSIVYMVGNICLAVGAIPRWEMPANTLTLLGLSLISIGTGGIKPCVTAFGADQFTLPEQAKQLASYFSLFYMSINAGALISTIVTPILREDVSCFGQDTCFSVAFGVPGLLMVIAVCIFVAGKPFYKIINPTQNMLVMVSKCIWNAIYTKFASRSIESAPKDHWLDYAEAEHGPKLVEDVKCLLRILLMYVPLPLFWALQDQQGSRWTLQATRLDGDIFGINIKPDQMLVLNPMLVILLIPVCELYMYPIMVRLGVKKPLQKLVVGMALTAIAFFASGLLELKLESLKPVRPAADECQLRIFNGLNETITFKPNFTESLAVHDFDVPAFDFLENKHMQVPPHSNLFAQNYLAYSKKALLHEGSFNLKAGKAVSYFITTIHNRIQLVEYEDSPDTPHQGVPVLRVLSTNEQSNEVKLKEVGRNIVKIFRTNDTALQPFLAGRYQVFVGDKFVSELSIRDGGAYTLVISEYSPERFATKLFTIVEPNQVHMMWQIPQYVLISLGEIMFSVTGLEFSFTEAPDSMKSVLQACWQLTVTAGNLFVVLIAYLKIFDAQSSEFFMFTGLMCINVVIISMMAKRFRYRDLAPPPPVRRRSSLDDRAPAAVGVENRAFDDE